ncbi:MAG: hypothetical protein AB7K37_11020 [Cyclobacteriaceae bacterium]
MQPHFSNAMMNQGFTSVWNKYKPVLVQMMLASEFEPQQYKLFVHEFKSLNQRQRDFTFTLAAHQGKATNNIRTLPIASDLLYILNSSRKASELMTERCYEFSMDKQFILRVTRQEPSTDEI